MQVVFVRLHHRHTAQPSPDYTDHEVETGIEEKHRQKRPGLVEYTNKTRQQCGCAQPIRPITYTLTY